MTTTTAQTAGAVKCLICGTHNAEDVILCGSCFAPLSLVRDAEQQERKPRIVSVIGESNVGKTVYLGVLLDMLAQRAGDFEAVPRGAYSIDLQQNVISHLAHRKFPPKTPMESDAWHWAYYQVSRRGDPRECYDLVMPDMAGESLAVEVAAPKTVQVVSNLLDKSEGMLLVVDAALAAHGSSQPDFFALKMMSYIDAMKGMRRGRKIPTPIAVVLCKSDLCPESFNNPRKFVEANLNRFVNLCESRFESVEFFASSAVGSQGYALPRSEQDPVVPIPLHTALYGILEPFEWIIDQI